MKIKKVLIIFFGLSLAGLFFIKYINFEFFTYTHNKCVEGIVDDCISMINKIDSEAYVKDLHVIQYAQLKTLVDLPGISQQGEISSTDKVKAYISLPVSFDNEEMRQKARETIAMDISEKWCQRPSWRK